MSWFLSLLLEASSCSLLTSSAFLHFSSEASSIYCNPLGDCPLCGAAIKKAWYLSDVHKVDHIVAERKHKYRVCWLGYDAPEDTWVSKEEL